jgi:signal transduction histidine kinase
VKEQAVLGAIDDLGFGVVELRDGRIVDADERFLDLVGYGLGELRALADAGPLFVPDRRRAIVDRLAQAAQGEVPLPGSAYLLRRNGTPVEVFLAGRPLGDGGLLVLVRDASDDARRRDELAAYAEVVQRMPLGMVLWRVDDPGDPSSLRIVAVNTAVTAGSGRRPAELLGRTIDQVLHGDAAATTAAHLLDAHRTREMQDLGESVVTDAHGLPAPGTYRVALVPLPGDIVATLVENVSARREADRHRRDLLQRILDATSEERRRIAVGLHDDVIQTLAATVFDLEADLDGAAQRAQTTLREVIDRLRGLVFELLPPELEEGLAVGVDVAAGKTFAGTSTAVDLLFDLGVEPDAETSAMAYRIVVEALTNARRHARADRVRVELRSDEAWLTGVVADDGAGADELVTPPGHLGLRTMKERAELLGGSCSVRSVPGEGTVVEFRVPTAAG